MDIENSGLLKQIEPFVNLDDSSDLKKIHELICRDLNLSSIYLQFSDLTGEDKLKTMSLHDKLRFLASSNRIEHYREIVVLFVRIVACTPHSADVNAIPV